MTWALVHHVQELIPSPSMKLAKAKSVPQSELYNCKSMHKQSPEKITAFEMQAYWLHPSRTKA